MKNHIYYIYIEREREREKEDSLQPSLRLLRFGGRFAAIAFAPSSPMSLSKRETHETRIMQTKCDIIEREREREREIERTAYSQGRGS